MELNISQKLHGFEVTRIRPMSEPGARLVEMRHEKTGAGLCWLDNGEDNKLFSIAFKTVPENSTGVFHILEHSVLCGSEKYPVKEPFVELLKSSMNTFLNAMTFPDKTMYPVSSRNEKDYLNLAGVYLDAVFAPRLLSDPNIFYQEGWHTEVNEGVPSYKGVVFNEMKGDMAGLSSIVNEAVSALNFPDSCYRFNSGGDPTVIPDLSYEMYCDSYRRFYHPSNSYVFLDGNVPLEATLELINSYLSRFEASSASFPIAMQAPAGGTSTVYYALGESESEENKAALALGKVIASWEEKNKIMACEVVCDYLADSNDSPLKRALLSAGLAEDLSLGIYDGTAQASLRLTAKNTSPEKFDRILETVRSTARTILEEGIDREEMLSCINRYSFRLRSAREPKGLINAINALSSWLYGGDPILYLQHDEAVAALREMLDNGGYEELIREMLLDENGLAIVHALPSKTVTKELNEKENARLAAEMEARSQQDKAALELLNADLARWQSTPDSPQQLATLPVLDLNEVSPEPFMTPTQAGEHCGVTVLRHNVASRGIAHLALYFSLADRSLEELSSIALLPSLLGELATENYSGRALQQQIKTYLGSLRFAMVSFAAKGDKSRCKPCLAVYCSVLRENLDKAQELLAEILLRSRFDQPERIREVLLQKAEYQRQMGIMGGHMLARNGVMSHFSATEAVSDATQAYSFGKHLQSLAADFEARLPGLVELYEDVRSLSFCRSRLVLSLTSDFDALPAGLLSALPQGSPAPENSCYTSLLPRRMGIRIPTQVGFASRGGQAEYEGSLRVAAKIISLSHLWNAVRVQGGAYGVGLTADRLGQLAYYSFRDPTPVRSLEKYSESGDFLRAFCAGEESLDKFIISTVSDTEPLESPDAAGIRADTQYLMGLDRDSLRAERAQILKADKSGLLAWADALDSMDKDEVICVVGRDSDFEKLEGLTVLDL